MTHATTDHIDTEVTDFLAAHSHKVDEQGRRYVVRNGHLPERDIMTGAGRSPVEQPQVRDNSPDSARRVRFSPKVLPPYLKRTRQIEELIPWLYLKGVSTGDFGEALQALVGESAAGLIANVIVRLKDQWADEHEAWSKRDLTGKQYAYVWADGIYANVRLEDDANNRQCILVVMGATHDGRKELIAVSDGYRESEQSWSELLLSLKHRGLTITPKLAVADGALGFWAALRKVYPDGVAEQRCWVHKTANVLNNLPKSVQLKAKSDLKDIYAAPTREEANRAFDHFPFRNNSDTYDAKYAKACNCLTKDRDVLLAFYDFPAQHWGHIRTTNPIESTFATIRLRQRKTKGCGSRRASLAMMFKLAESAAKRWRRLDGYDQIVHIMEGRTFIDGELQQEHAA